MRVIKLKTKIFIISFLRWTRLIPDEWHQCEFDLAEIKAKEYDDFFNKSN